MPCAQPAQALAGRPPTRWSTPPSTLGSPHAVNAVQQRSRHAVLLWSCANIRSPGIEERARSRPAQAGCQARLAVRQAARLNCTVAANTAHSQRPCESCPFSETLQGNRVTIGAHRVDHVHVDAAAQAVVAVRAIQRQRQLVDAVQRPGRRLLHIAMHRHARVLVHRVHAPAERVQERRQVAPRKLRAPPRQRPSVPVSPCRTGCQADGPGCTGPSHAAHTAKLLCFVLQLAKAADPSTTLSGLRLRLGPREGNLPGRLHWLGAGYREALRTVTAKPLSTRLKRAVHRPSKRPAPMASASAQAASVGLPPSHSTIQLRAPKARPFAACTERAVGANRPGGLQALENGSGRAATSQKLHAPLTWSYLQGRPHARHSPATAAM